MDNISVIGKKARYPEKLNVSKDYILHRSQDGLMTVPSSSNFLGKIRMQLHEVSHEHRNSGLAHCAHKADTLHFRQQSLLIDVLTTRNIDDYSTLLDPTHIELVVRARDAEDHDIRHAYGIFYCERGRWNF